MSRIRLRAVGSRRYFVPRDRATIVSTTALQNGGSAKGFLASHVQEVREGMRRVRGRRVRIEPQARGLGELRDDRPRERGRRFGPLEFRERTERGLADLHAIRLRLAA